jgi:hypothetical protein
MTSVADLYRLVSDFDGHFRGFATDEREMKRRIKTGRTSPLKD